MPRLWIGKPGRRSECSALRVPPPRRGVQPRGRVLRPIAMELSNRLFRSRDERMLAGVAGGLATHFDIDPTIIRLAWVLAFLATGPLAILLYVVCALVIPREPETTLV